MWAANVPCVNTLDATGGLFVGPGLNNPGYGYDGFRRGLCRGGLRR